MKVYYAAPISTTAEFNDSKRVARLIRELGYEVYAAAENASINDKTNDPTPTDIYDADMGELLTSDIVVVNLTGGHADGTITEVGAVAGFNEHLTYFNTNREPIEVLAYTSNARLLKPQFHKGIPSASANHLTLGAIEKWGAFVGTEFDMLLRLGKR